MNRQITKLISALLTAAMILCLCACGSQNIDGGHTEQTESGKTESADSEKSKPSNSERTESTDSPKLTHVADYKPVASVENSFSPQLYTADGIYCTVSEKVEGTVSENSGTQDVYRTSLCFIDYDGNEMSLPDFKALDPAQCGLLIPEGARDTFQSSEILNVIDGGDGRLVLLEHMYISYHDVPGNIGRDNEEYDASFMSMERTYLRVIGRTGAEESCNVLDVPFSEDFSTMNGAVCESQLVCAAGNTVTVFAMDGSCLYSLDSRYWFDRMLVIDDRLYALGSFDERTCLVAVDLQARAFGEERALDLNGWDFTTGGGAYDVYSNTGTALMGYDLETGRSGEVLSWLSGNINGYDLSTYAVRDDGSVVTVESRWDRDHTTCENHVILLYAEAYETVPQEIVLTLACKFLNDQLVQAVNDFNRENDHCRIEVVDYSQYNNENDWNAGVIRMNAEIMAGNGPDIIVLDGLPVKQYAAKGILADLYPFIDADPELDRGDFFESILRACENDGKLYTTVSGFSIDTCIGDADVVGGQPGWNYQQFLDALASMPEGCTPFNQYTTREIILYYILGLELDRFVDWNTGKCSFDSPEFIDLLEFAKTFPETAAGVYAGIEDAEPNRIASGKQMLMRNGIYCFSDFQMYDAMFGGNCTYIGYPTSSGTGNMIQLDTGYAISATCKVPEAAWEFVRTFFTADYQRDLEWSLPSNREVFGEKLGQLMTPVYLQDESGRYVLDENGSKIETDQGSMKYGDVVIGYRALTQDQADKIMALVERTERLYDYDKSIASIVTEEAATFFYGQKSAGDVAELIQNRVNIYVGEQR